MNRITDELAREANRLYWETEISVADIATQLELSRRALYDTIAPLPTGNPCPTCGAILVFENRSGRNSGEEVCIACIEGEAADDHEEAAHEELSAFNGVPEGVGAVEVGEYGERALRVGGAALAGAALGAIATLFLVQKK